MKKLIALILVLGIASFANAALIELSLDGATNGSGVTQETTVAVCTYVVIDVHGAADHTYLGYVIIQDDSEGGGEWLTDDGEGGTYPKILAGAGDMAKVTDYTYAGWGFGYELVADYAPGGSVGGAEFELLFHCTSVGDVTITLWEDPDYTTPADTIIIHQIPEPLTIALLGLGGLFLRRRR